MKQLNLFNINGNGEYEYNEKEVNNFGKIKLFQLDNSFLMTNEKEIIRLIKDLGLEYVISQIGYENNVFDLANDGYYIDIEFNIYIKNNKKEFVLIEKDYNYIYSLEENRLFIDKCGSSIINNDVSLRQIIEFSDFYN